MEKEAGFLAIDKGNVTRMVQTMDKQERKPIKIALLGMDERSVIRMATIFKVVFKERCEVASGEQADLAIVDLDGKTDAWASFRQQFPNLSAIVLSESASTAEGAVYISKPAKLSLLWESILRLVIGLPSPAEFAARYERASTEVESDTTASSVSNTAQSTTPKPTQSTDAQVDTANNFNPDDYLLGHLLTCLKECIGRECSISVQCGKDQQLVIFPHNGQVLCSLDNDQFEQLSAARSNKKFTLEINHDTASSEAAAYKADGLQFIPIDYLLWDLAQRTACGRVPVGTDLSRLFYLRCWPNFSRLPPTPHGMRIASLWVGEPRTLDDVAMSLGIEKAEIYSFYSAAVATGLAGPAKRQVDGLIEPRSATKKNVAKRDVHNAILRHIGKH